MNTHQKVRLQRLEKALITFCGLLLVSLLMIFAIQPSIFPMVLTPGLATTELYPLLALLFLAALIVFLCLLMYGVLRHWRSFFWLILLATARLRDPDSRRVLATGGHTSQPLSRLVEPVSGRGWLHRMWLCCLDASNVSTPRCLDSGSAQVKPSKGTGVRTYRSLAV